MEVLITRTTYDYEAGSVVDMPRDQAFAYVKAELGEFVKPKRRTKKVQVEDRVVDTPENRAEEEL